MYENIKVIDRIRSVDASYIAEFYVEYGILKNTDDIEKALKYRNALISLKNNTGGHDHYGHLLGGIYYKKYNNNKQILEMER